MQTSTDKAGGKPFDGSPVAGDAPKAVPETLLRKLLLVDDEPDGAEFAAVLLRSNGLKVVVVHSASEALQVLQEDSEIDAILSDVMMPGMSGLQLADAVRAMYPTIKIVLMSGFVLPDMLKNREREYLFVEKPYKIDALLKVLCS
jgi:CheY-like chemotaxis protein